MTSTRTKVKPATVEAHSSNGRPTTSWVQADKIKVDPATQRALRPQWAKQLADNWSDAKVGIIDVSRRSGGGLYVTDGQHRLVALKLRGEAKRYVEVRIHDGLSKADEAIRFGGLNTTKNVSHFDLFHVSLQHDKDSVEIKKMIESVGLTLDVTGKDGKIAATSACQDVYFGKLFRSGEPTPWALARALRTLTGAWGMNRDAVTSVMIRAAGGVHLRYGDAIDQGRLIRQLALFNGGPVQVLSRGKIRREMTAQNLWRSVAEVMVDSYNKGLRKSPLPDWNAR